VRPRTDNALACGPAAQAHVQEAAEGQPEKPGENGSEDARHGRD